MTMITIQAMNITVLHKTFMAILTRGFGLLSPASLAYAPVQPVQISTADNDATVKKTVSRKLSILKATHRIKRYPITAVIICTIFLVRKPGGGKRPCFLSMLSVDSLIGLFLISGVLEDG